MALNWDVSEVVAREGEAYVWAGDQLAAVSEALVWASMVTGVPALTEANWLTAAARLRAWESAVGPFLRSGPIPADEVRRHIGLTTSAAPLKLADFERKVGRAVLDKRKREVEAEAAADARRRVDWSDRQDVADVQTAAVLADRV